MLRLLPESKEGASPALGAGLEVDLSRGEQGEGQRGWGPCRSVAGEAGFMLPALQKAQPQSS